MVAEPIVVVGGRGRKKEAWREWKKAKWPKSHWPEVAHSRVRSGVAQARVSGVPLVAQNWKTIDAQFGMPKSPIHSIEI